MVCVCVFVVQLAIYLKVLCFVRCRLVTCVKMAAFKKKRKAKRKEKVKDDKAKTQNKSKAGKVDITTDGDPKRQRRGVSVFHLQLKKRKNWVTGYEAGM